VIKYILDNNKCRAPEQRAKSQRQIGARSARIRGKDQSILQRGASLAGEGAEHNATNLCSSMICAQWEDPKAAIAGRGKGIGIEIIEVTSCPGATVLAAKRTQKRSDPQEGRAYFGTVLFSRTIAFCA
jgi:hypothetical protein